MEKIISKLDLKKLIDIKYFPEGETEKQLASWITENISEWKKIKEINVDEISLGIYYVFFLLARNSLQTIIENTSDELGNSIEKELKDADNYFFENMKPKYFHYESDIGILKKKNYFWMTHTIHPIDESIIINPESVCSISREKLNTIEDSWNVLRKTFSNRFSKNILHIYRESQVITPRLELEYFMWRISDGEYQMNEYSKELMNTILMNNPNIDFTKKLLLGILAQYLYFGKFNGQLRNWGLICINYLDKIKSLETTYDYKNIRRIIVNL